MIEKDDVLKEIIMIEKQNYKENINDFRTRLKERKSPTSETVFSLYCELYYRLTNIRIKENKEYILIAKYCKKVFKIILSNKDFKEVCENKKI